MTTLYGCNLVKESPLIDIQKELNATIGEFAGVKTALDYGDPIREHIETRKSVTVFDISHMGRIHVVGKDSHKLLNYLIAKDLEKSRDFSMFGPTAFLNEKGGFKDDVMLYRISIDEWLIVCNAVNRSKIYTWLVQWIDKLKLNDVKVHDVTEKLAMIAVQGPRALEVMTRIAQKPLENLKPLQFLKDMEFPEIGRVFIISRSGWTGEDGFEVIGDVDTIRKLFRYLVTEFNVIPAGLIARDSLRIEMGYCLYDNEIHEDITPIEARYWVFDEKKRGYVGEEAIRRKLREGVEMVRYGLRVKKGIRFIPRKGYRILIEDVEIGYVTSGTYSPILDRAIAQGYINVRYALPGLRVLIEIRGKTFEARITDFPFIQK